MTEPSDTASLPPSAAQRITHPLLVGFASFIILGAGVQFGIAAMFAGPVALPFLLLVPLALAGSIAGIAKLALDRARPVTSIVISMALTALTASEIFFGRIAEAFPTLGPIAVAPVVALLAVPLSLLQQRGWIKVVGVVALVAVVVVLSLPAVQEAEERHESAQAAEASEYDRRLEASVVPFTTAALTIDEAQIGQDTSIVRGALPDGSAASLTTTRLWTTDDLSGQLCFTARAVAATDDSTPCAGAAPGVVQVTVGTLTATATARGDDRMVTAVTRSPDEGLRILGDLVPLDEGSTDEWFRVQWERDRSV